MKTDLRHAIEQFKGAAHAITGPHGRVSGYDRGYTDAMRYVVSILEAMDAETHGKRDGSGE